MSDLAESMSYAPAADLEGAEPTPVSPLGDG